jgi:phosphate transport system substrate-binding protein
MKYMRKIFAIAITVVLMSTVFVGCNQTVETSSNSSIDVLSGSIIYDGSSALAPLVDLASPMFKVLYPNVSIPTAGTKGSGTGVAATLAGTIDIGGSDVVATSFTDAISIKKLEDHQICIIGFAAVVDKSLGITNLTTAQLIKVFTDSTVTSWNQINSSFPNKPITVVVRAAGSGTRVVFDSVALGGKNIRSDSVIVTGSSSGDVESKVNNTIGAIGYLALSYTISSAGTNVLPLNINGIAPSYANIYNGSYNIIGIEHLDCR